MTSDSENIINKYAPTGYISEKCAGPSSLCAAQYSEVSIYQKVAATYLSNSQKTYSYFVLIL